MGIVRFADCTGRVDNSQEFEKAALMLDHGTQFSVAKANGFVLPDGARVLDLGCGNGSGVAALLALGFEAVGCDLRLRKSGPHRDRLYREGRLRVMESPRRLPFDDETFDGVFSQNVLEHVQDYEATLSEIARVLKPNGVSVHMFPSCWTLVEGHVHVPLATFFRPYWYLLLWAWVGVRKRSQNGWSAIRTARHNRWYLTTATNYLSGRRIMDYAQRHFETRAFCERQAWLDASRIVRRFPFLRVVPVWWLRRTFRTRILLVAHPRTNASVGSSCHVIRSNPQ